MSMLSLCLNSIKNEIPESLISEFTIASRYGRNPWSAVDEDAVLIAEVFERRLMPDLNVEYARTLEIPLQECMVEKVSEMDYVVTVPPKATGGYKILTVLGINTANIYPNGIYADTATVAGSSILAAAQKLANSNQSVSLNYNARCEMISPNAFRIRRMSYLPPGTYAEVLIEHDSNLNSLNMTAAAYFKKLAVLATKAAIYNKLKIRVNQAKLDGGSELGAFSEFLDSYADANELYLEELKKASKIGWLSDLKLKYDLYSSVSSNLI